MIVTPTCFPLLSHAGADDAVAYRAGVAISRARFMGDVRQLISLLPPGGRMLNICRDRYHFAVGLAASLVSGGVCLLPPAQTPDMLGELLAFAPDLYCLCDDDTPVFGLPVLTYPQGMTSSVDRDPVPEIDGARMVVWIFTSGSTGKPQAHAKHWGELVGAVRAGARRMGLCDGRRHALVATVPPQHMFGFEASVLLAWQSGAAFDAGRPFYPEDISAAIAAVPHPRALVTTPYHLRHWLDGAEALPALDLIVSATAPLTQGLAQDAEALSGARVFEIYGSTETGQLASRSTAQRVEWQLYDGVHLSFEQGRIWVSGAHVIPRVELHDVLERVGEDRFIFHGRTADLVNIAGKRSSLAYLNYQLNTIPGVLDGVFYMPLDETPDGVTRLMAFVVAPQLTPSSLKAALRHRVDPLFLPRPVYFVAALPRNENGKLTQAAMLALVLSCAQETER